MRILFVKSHLAFPRSSGHDVHCYHMMQSLANMGHSVFLLTKTPVSIEATAKADLKGTYTFESQSDQLNTKLTKLQERFCSYWGVNRAHIGEVQKLADRLKCDAVIVVGLEVLPYLSGIRNQTRIWYAADEWLFHHFSQIFLSNPSSWANAKQGIIKGLYEFAFAKDVDRVWLVSKSDAVATKLVMPSVSTDVLPNGVDTTHFSPIETNKISNSCTIWGRLDFGPNIDAICWFAKNVWPLVRSQVADARFDVFGFNPSKELLNISKTNDFNVIPDLPDIREEITRRRVVVMPFVSGGGIKNKFLEAAAMGMPIIASQRSTNGIEVPEAKPWISAQSKQDWAKEIVSLWKNPDRQRELGQAARCWAENTATWKQTAEKAVLALQNGKR